MSQFKTLPVVFVILTVIFFFSNCSTESEEDFVINPEFTKYLSAFTSGVVSSESAIEIQLVKPREGKIKPNEPVDEELFSISPEIQGKTVWSDPQTVKFIPSKKLKSGETYWVEFDLGKVSDVPEELRVFKFPFKVVNQAINVEADGLKAYSNESVKWQQFLGQVIAADAIEKETLSKCISFEVGGKKKKIKWEMQPNGRMYTLVVDSIERKKNAQEITIRWDGSKAVIEGSGQLTHEVPALGDFKITTKRVVQYPDQHVLVRFSDPLLYGQNLDGLVEIRGYNSIKTAVSTNELRIYPANRLIGEKTVIISGSIKNCEGYLLDRQEQFQVRFEALKPAVRLTGKGTILPSSNGMIVPFEAVNLKAVDVRIIKIYENNIAQFFQVNNYDGNRELKRVGRVIRKKTIYLDKGKPLDLGRWNRFNLDLSQYIKVDQGSIYRVEIGFRKHHSTYPCETEEDIEMDESDWNEYDDAEKEEWDYIRDYGYGYYYDDYYYGYDYEEQDNPCSYSYYRDNSVVKNIFASDIGVIAKKGTNGEVFVVVTDLVTAKPISGAKVQLFDYQQQKIASLTTDQNGIARSERLRKTPFFVIAEEGNQKGYLRLDDGSSLALSRFDVGGEVIQEGIKGFIYGERGVWRPGDTLFLSFILEDKENIIPENHPVIFELTNPRGQMVQRMVRNSSLNGFYSFTTATDPDAPTGNWEASVKVGGAVFRKTLKIETVKPNRLKIHLKLDEEILSAQNNSVSGKLSVKWLHGAPAKNLKTDITVNYIKTATVFDRYKNYQFDDPAKRFYPEEKMIFKGNLDDQGEKMIQASLEAHDQSPGMLKAIFKTRAYEPGGDFSTDQFAVPFAPYETFVGIKSPEVSRYGALQTDTSYSFPLVSVNKHGKAVKNTALEIEVYKVDWSWWWERGSDNLASYIARSNVRPVSSQKATTDSDGKAYAKIKISKYDWGRYLIRVTNTQSGHSTGIMTYFDWPSWMSRAGRKNPDGANMLVFSSDKEKYNVGEKARISFPSSKNGHALISIEDGKKVKDAFWIETTASETSFTLPITSEMTPNCYVHITMIQPHKQTENDAPIRLYGVIPLMVEDPATKLTPVINMPDELAPESTFSIKVKEKDGKPMTYTIAVVDEGLLDLTRFQTPDPWGHFYSREALGVKTWDLYDWVIGAYGAKVENLLTIGGDGSLKPGNENTIRFKPMVRYLGPFALAKGKEATHKISVPNYIGSVRTMVIAGQQGAYGHAEKTVPVKKPLMVLATLPRVLGPSEKVNLPVTVFAMDKSVKDVKLQVKTNHLLNVTGGSYREIKFSTEGDQVVNFELDVLEKIGKATVEIIATSGKERSTYEIELDVRNPNLPVHTIEETVVEAGNNWSYNLKLPGMNGTNSLVLEVSSIPPINLEKRLAYLIQYPHGCVEQTTSSAFPQLYLSDIMNTDKDLKTRINTNVSEALNRLHKFQLNSGGFGYWPGAGHASDWGTTYAGHFMLEAEKKGFALPYGMKKQWLAYQRKMAREWSPVNRGYYYSNYDLAQAYRLYTLCLAGEPELSAMNRLRESKDLSVQAAWRLSAAYQLIGNKEVAKKLVRNKATQVKPYQELGYTYGSEERDQAMIIETLVLLGDKSKAAGLVRELSEKLSSSKWMSTQTTAYALKAIAQFAGGAKSTSGMNYTYSYKGKSVSGNSKLPLELEDLKVSDNQEYATVEFSNKGNDILFVRLIAKGIPLAGDEQSTENNLSLNVVYKNVKGETISVEELQQGTDFYAEVTVSNPGMRGDYQELALTQLFPSGWEIHNHRMDLNDPMGDRGNYSYQDIRDDRVYTYFDLRKNSSKTFVIKLHAAYIGEYYLPAVRCEAMYDNSIFGLRKGNRVSVVRPGGKVL
ncbi:MAG: MG2 domain-containing protein [Brumimicrobium sp.]|nr:MG2 domain-containing protein [Brumimicrobium sp.]